MRIPKTAQPAAARSSRVQSSLVASRLWSIRRKALHTHRNLEKVGIPNEPSISLKTKNHHSKPNPRRARAEPEESPSQTRLRPPATHSTDAMWSGLGPAPARARAREIEVGIDRTIEPPSTAPSRSPLANRSRTTTGSSMGKERCCAIFVPNSNSTRTCRLRRRVTHYLRAERMVSGEF